MFMFLVLVASLVKHKTDTKNIRGMFSAETTSNINGFIILDSLTPVNKNIKTLPKPIFLLFFDSFGFPILTFVRFLRFLPCKKIMNFQKKKITLQPHSSGTTMMCSRRKTTEIFRILLRLGKKVLCIFSNIRLRCYGGRIIAFRLLSSKRRKNSVKN